MEQQEGTSGINNEGHQENTGVENSKPSSHKKLIYIIIAIVIIVSIFSYMVFWSFLNYPENIKTEEGKGSIVVSWDDVNKLGFSHYELYRQEKSNVKVVLVADNIAQSTLKDRNAEENKNYIYSVKAVNVLGFRTKAIFTNEIFWSSPSQPLNVILRIQDDDVELAWDESMEPDLLGYNIYRSSESGVVGEKITSELVFLENYFLDQDVSIDVDDYYYRVKAVDRAGNESEASDQVTYVLNSPFSLQVTKKNASLFLSWDSDIVEDFPYYNIYRSINASGEKDILEKNVKEEQYQDFNTENGIDYYYWVKVFDQKGFRSGFSTAISGKWQLPASPSNFKVRKIEDGVMELTWSPNQESDIAGYNMYGGTGGTGRLNDELVTGLSYIHKLVNINSDLYYYRIKAVDTAGNESSGFSQLVRIKLNPNAEFPKFDFTKQEITVTGLSVERIYENQNLIMVIRWNPVTSPQFSHYEICAPSISDPCSSNGKVVAAHSVFTNEYLHRDFIGESMFYYVRAVYNDGSKSNYTRFWVKRDGASFQSAPNVGDVIDGTK